MHVPQRSLVEAVRFFAPLFPPKIIQDAAQLRAFVAGPEFDSLRSVRGDRAAVDTLYAEALRLSWKNTAEALLISMLATIEHRRLEFRLPLIGLILPLPLTTEFQEEFDARVESLPGRLYADSPRTPHGDRDKLQHFFGSAFLAYILESEDRADDVGHFVESGESRFVPGETVDDRDIRTNRQGQRFARALLAGQDVRPTAFLLPAPEIILSPGGH